LFLIKVERARVLALYSAHHLAGKITMKIRYGFAALLLMPLLSHAEIYKSVDADGHVTYSSAPIKGGKKIILEPLSTMQPPARARSAASPEGFPKVDGNTQKGRDDTRRKILQDELNAEQKLLDEAKQNLADGQANPEVYKTQGGKTFRNVAQYDAKVKTLTEQVELHQKNIEALNTELSKLK